MKLPYLLLAASLVSLPVSSAFGQAATPQSTVPKASETTPAQRHSIRARQTVQQQRIAHGVRDGQITQKGAARAEQNQAKISSEEHSMRSADNGHLTAQDRQKLATQQNRDSQGIYDRNHNQSTDPGVAPK
jgi:hypothetical protein